MDVRFEQRVNIKRYCASTTPVLPWSLSVRFFSVSKTEKKAKRTATWEYRAYSSGCDDGAHRHSERTIHQLFSGLAETLATGYWLRRELLRRGQEALVVRMNFVFFTDSVSELYGQRMYTNHSRPILSGMKGLILLQTLPDLSSSYIQELTANIVNDSCINNEVQFKSKIKHTGTRSAAAWPHRRSILPPPSAHCAFFPASKISMRFHKCCHFNYYLFIIAEVWKCVKLNCVMWASI
jgi:hypothetical protein